MELYRRELLKGSTDTLILSMLAEEPMYGYQLVREMNERSSGYFRLKEGTLYPALHRLERDDYVVGMWEESPSGQSRRYYSLTPTGESLTPTGERRLESRLVEWDAFTKAVNLIAQPVANLARGVLKG